MSNVARVAKNSMWLLLQPVVLNILSLLAMPYIARVLGEADYGRFILAFSVVAMFAPLGNMGLRAVTVRRLSQMHEPAERETYTANALGARLFLTVGAMLAVAVAVNLMRYDSLTKVVVYLAIFTLLIEAVTSTLQDVFYALENMRYVAYSRFIGGLTLTILSVAVLFVGMRVIGFTVTYLVGGLLTMVLTWHYAGKFLRRRRATFDWRFLRSAVKGGAPFFYPTLVATFCSKAGVSMLPLFGGVAAVGAYGAASGLIERLLIIPDGVCTSIYPTLSRAHVDSPPQAQHLFRKYFEYLLIIGLPIAVGTTIMAGPIIRLLFGEQYLRAIPVLIILSWWLFLTFLSSLLGWTLGAIQQEKKGALVGFITAPLGVLLTLALLPFQHERALAWANLITVCVTLLLLSHFIRATFMRKFVRWSWLARVIVANALMGSLVYWVHDLVLAVPIVVGIASYPVACLAIGVVRVDELKQLWMLVLRRPGKAPSDASDS